ncbi:MAG: glycyl radical protein [Burkholderiales bacterium]|nr:glycyl radical protein [Burkholderiales bacterium]
MTDARALSAIALSAQETAIVAGRKAVHDNVSPRVLRLFEAIRDYGPPRVTLDRAVLFTESFKATEGQPLVLRWAKALLHVARNLPVTIFDDELVVGRPNTWLGRYGLVYGELDGSLMQSAAEHFIRNRGNPAGVAITDLDRALIDETLAPYWQGRDFTPNFVKALPAQTRFMIFGPDADNIAMQTGVMMASAVFRHSQNWAHDFAKILTRGCKGIREDAQQRLAALEHPRDLVEAKPFLEAVVITCDALATWARRYAARAAEMAASEADPRRKKELDEIAAICAWVPENPARTFREALQSQWFMQMFSRLEQNIGGQVSQGRMDQYFYPYYQRDLAEGRVTEAEAAELLQCVWLNMMQSAEVKLSPTAAASMEGFAHFEQVTIGGRRADGRDATNELTYLMLEAARPLQSSYPELAVRIHSNTPDRLLHAVAEAIKDGKGMPKVLNDEQIVPFYLANGATTAEALDYCGSGCIESRLVNRETQVTGNGVVNYGAVVEMMLANGRVRLWKDLPFGVATGDPRGFATFDDVWAAFRAQLLNVVKHVMVQHYVAMAQKPRYFAAPFASMLHDLAYAQCKDLHRHGEYIDGAIDLSCIESVGKGTAIDSLAAIKHLVYDTRKVTWDELLAALDRNWEGCAAIRELCLNAPKYGNGIEWVDELGFDIERTILEYAHAHPKPHGQSFMLRCIPVTVHVPMGKVVWATPNGRPAQEFLSEGISASHGMDVKGPTTALHSIARARCLGFREKAADLINMKFTPATLAGEQGTRRLMAIIRTWCDLKLWHVQFNVLNRQTLLEAQKDPQKYRNLVVRIAGYSAYFVDLSPMQQAEILARTEEAII